MVRCHGNNTTTNSSTSKSTSTSGEQYVLSLEYLGGLVPIMAGVRVSKLRPEFVVYELRASRRLSERRQQQNVATATASTSCELRTGTYALMHDIREWICTCTVRDLLSGADLNFYLSSIIVCCFQNYMNWSGLRQLRNYVITPIPRQTKLECRIVIIVQCLSDRCIYIVIADVYDAVCYNKCLAFCCSR